MLQHLYWSHSPPTLLSLTDTNYVGSTQPQATLKSSKLVPKHDLSWYSNMRDVGKTQRCATSVALTDMSYVDLIYIGSSPTRHVSVAFTHELCQEHSNHSYISNIHYVSYELHQW